MTKDYEEQLRVFSTLENRTQAEAYFQKYWLSTDEYNKKWLSVQNSIFDVQAKHLPDLMFNGGYELLPLAGVNIFTSEKDFLSLQNCMQETGDEYFAVVQNENVVIKFYFGDDKWDVHPLLRFKFPIGISWEEIMSGGYVSIELFQGAAKDYFVFGDSGNWGRYVANSYENPAALPTFSTPLNIMGFKKEYSEMFRKNFEHLANQKIVSAWLPDSYKQLSGAPF